ncbi:GNAT family N-acetyltransferase [Vitreoscilla stercoraria]|uniref:GNAT family N-acetyltransferase n=1 Tax=Vitreoscilla stercoraria TaxID=61 RepID=A0ABY4EDV8_VITST|nr:GNAT family N-acetyltransferase [Vitreoscilla stercoraria]UOO93471.1 GNAT family N-acetyltransferase [Vitreoscilla stercoraria]
MLNQYELIIEPFIALNLYQLHQILQLRQRVFMLEQQSLYLDADNDDLDATHIMLYDGPKLVGYTRIVPPHLSMEYVQIGRIALVEALRSQGMGSELLQVALDTAKRQFPNLPVHLSAQIHLQTWYEAFGFETFGDVFDDGGVKHVKMRWNGTSK